MTEINWQPTAPLANLRLRAQCIARIRQFFAEREVLEVETPQLSRATVTDPYLSSLKTQLAAQTFYLQTSPEFAMKRLLAAGSGSIYQIAKAFRDDEIGAQHNPEFTLLEWYRIGFDDHALMDEVSELLSAILQTPTAKRNSYLELFWKNLQINPHTASVEELQNCAQQHKLNLSNEFAFDDQTTWLQLLMHHCIEPLLGKEVPQFVYDFPVEQAALARINKTQPACAKRFELYYRDMELANGFHELTDAVEQAQRFEKDLAFRQKNQLVPVPIDNNLLAALQHGLPDCAGVALGVDRLIMLAVGASHIDEVISFPIC